MPLAALTVGFLVCHQCNLQAQLLIVSETTYSITLDMNACDVAGLTNQAAGAPNAVVVQFALRLARKENARLI